MKEWFKSKVSEIGEKAVDSMVNIIMSKNDTSSITQFHNTPLLTAIKKSINSKVQIKQPNVIYNTSSLEGEKLCKIKLLISEGIFLLLPNGTLPTTTDNVRRKFYNFNRNLNNIDDINTPITNEITPTSIISNYEIPFNHLDDRKGRLEFQPFGHIKAHKCKYTLTIECNNNIQKSEPYDMDDDPMNRVVWNYLYENELFDINDDIIITVSSNLDVTKYLNDPFDTTPKTYTRTLQSRKNLINTHNRKNDNYYTQTVGRAIISLPLILDSFHNNSPPEVQSNSHSPAESSSPPEVTTSVPTQRGAYSNSLPVNGNATPGDRGSVYPEEQEMSTPKNENIQPGGTETSTRKNLDVQPGGTKSVNPEEQDVNDVTSTGKPENDLREFEGEVNGRGTTPSGMTSSGISNGKDGLILDGNIDSVKVLSVERRGFSTIVSFWLELLPLNEHKMDRSKYIRPFNGYPLYGMKNPKYSLGYILITLEIYWYNMPLYLNILNNMNKSYQEWIIQPKFELIHFMSIIDRYIYLYNNKPLWINNLLIPKVFNPNEFLFIFIFWLLLFNLIVNTDLNALPIAIFFIIIFISFYYKINNHYNNKRFKYHNIQLFNNINQWNHPFNLNHIQNNNTTNISNNINKSPSKINSIEKYNNTTTPPEVQSTSVPLAVEASSNYLSLKGEATPGDRGVNPEEQEMSTPKNENIQPGVTENSTRKNVDIQPLRTGNPPEVTTTVGLADSSSNYLSLKGDATPRDRGEGSDGSSIMGMMEDGTKDVLNVTSSGKPVADLREAEGEVNRRAVCKTTSGGKDKDITSSETPRFHDCTPESNLNEMDVQIDNVVITPIDKINDYNIDIQNSNRYNIIVSNPSYRSVFNEEVSDIELDIIDDMNIEYNNTYLNIPIVKLNEGLQLNEESSIIKSIYGEHYMNITRGIDEQCAIFSDDKIEIDLGDILDIVLKIINYIQFILGHIIIFIEKIKYSLIWESNINTIFNLIILSTLLIPIYILFYIISIISFKIYRYILFLLLLLLCLFPNYFNNNIINNNYKSNIFYKFIINIINWYLNWYNKLPDQREIDHRDICSLQSINRLTKLLPNNYYINWDHYQNILKQDFINLHNQYDIYKFTQSISNIERTIIKDYYLSKLQSN